MKTTNYWTALTNESNITTFPKNELDSYQSTVNRLLQAKLTQPDVPRWNTKDLQFEGNHITLDHDCSNTYIIGTSSMKRLCLTSCCTQGAQETILLILPCAKKADMDIFISLSLINIY